jgi:hypothetical protein
MAGTIMAAGMARCFMWKSIRVKQAAYASTP